MIDQRITSHIFLAWLLCCTAWLAHAHDGNSNGGLFRSRDAGATWLPADPGLFINMSSAIAISPTDGNHLLYGADGRLLSSHNGGRDWHHEGVNVVTGPIISVTFSSDGIDAYATNGVALYRKESAGEWQVSDVSSSILPIRQIVSGPSAIYLAANDGVYVSIDKGKNWRGLSDGLPEEPISALLAGQGTPTGNIHALVGGRVWFYDNTIWRQAKGDWSRGRVDSLSADSQAPTRLWAAGSSQIFRSDDGGKTWQRHGNPLSDPNLFLRGLAVADGGNTIAVTTHRGLVRSADSGKTWAGVEGALPSHLESGPLMQDTHDANTFYVGFALRPYSEPWNAALQAANALRNAAARSCYIVSGAVVGLLAIVTGMVFWKRKSQQSRHATQNNE